MACRMSEGDRQAENAAPQWVWLLRLPVRRGGRSAAYISSNGRRGRGTERNVRVEPVTVSTRTPPWATRTTHQHALNDFVVGLRYRSCGYHDIPRTSRPTSHKRKNDDEFTHCSAYSNYFGWLLFIVVVVVVVAVVVVVVVVVVLTITSRYDAVRRHRTWSKLWSGRLPQEETSTNRR